MQSGGVGIEVMEVDSGIAEQMDDDEHEHHLARECHQYFFAYGGCGEYH
jgi:hypothetical protein